MLTESQLPWILAGYELFAREGPSSLKVEVMARLVGKSKSSFYHHFVDLEIFTDFMLRYHLQRADLIADRERQCANVVPELLHVLVEFKQDLLFNRQLRVHRDVTHFRECFEKSSHNVAEAIIDIWAEMLGLGDNSRLALIVMKLSLENFYLQITDETMTYEWLENYVLGLKQMVDAFQVSEIRPEQG